ncbi:hypothetical protein VINE108274_18870 [Vibrio neptunius]
MGNLWMNFDKSLVFNFVRIKGCVVLTDTMGKVEIL